MEKHPGAVALKTKIVFVRMIRRVGSFHLNAEITKATEFRAKMNDALNDAVAKIDQHILTILSCNAYEDFDKCRNLSPHGKRAFWFEVDELLEKLDTGKIKLLPNPKNPLRSKPAHHNHERFDRYHGNHMSYPNYSRDPQDHYNSMSTSGQHHGTQDYYHRHDHNYNHQTKCQPRDARRRLPTPPSYQKF